MNNKRNWNVRRSDKNRLERVVYFLAVVLVILVIVANILSYFLT